MNNIKVGGIQCLSENADEAQMEEPSMTLSCRTIGHSAPGNLAEPESPVVGHKPSSAPGPGPSTEGSRQRRQAPTNSCVNTSPSP